MQLPEAFLTRMLEQLGEAEYAAYLAAMDERRPRALRVNTLKIGVEGLAALFCGALTPCGTGPEGFFVSEPFEAGRNPLHAAGLFYMQEPSAQVPAALLAARPHETVLDLCAAPGGKSGQLAAAMENTGLLIANEPVPARAAVLTGTLERLGVRNAVVTAMYPDALCPLLRAQCDAVLVDAPCSGEGMFRKEPQAVADWSERHVRSCAERQRAILGSAAEAVRPGGRLVYSTCTFSRAENEDLIADFLAAHPDFSLVSQQRLYPHTSPGEGQFAALLVRGGGAAGPAGGVADGGSRPGRPDAATAAAERFFAEAMVCRPAQTVRSLPDGRVFLLPERVPEALSRMRVLRAGVLAGEYRGSRFVPAHALYLAYPAADFCRSMRLEGQALGAYLAGETVACDRALAGYVAVCAGAYPVGFAKAVDGTLKNHLPKGLRIR